MPISASSGNTWLEGGTRFVKGDEIPQNVILAYAFFRAGASRDNRGAIENLGILSPHLTQAQRTEGDQIAARLSAGEPVPLATAADGKWQKPTIEDLRGFFAPIRAAGRSLSLGDLSTIEALIDTPGASILTSEGSPLDELFKCLMYVGWALRLNVLEDAAKPAPLLELEKYSRRYQLSDAGRENGKGFLKILLGDYSDRNRDL